METDITYVELKFEECGLDTYIPVDTTMNKKRDKTEYIEIDPAMFSIAFKETVEKQSQIRLYEKTTDPKKGKHCGFYNHAFDFNE